MSSSVTVVSESELQLRGYLEIAGLIPQTEGTLQPSERAGFGKPSGISRAHFLAATASPSAKLVR